MRMCGNSTPTGNLLADFVPYSTGPVVHGIRVGLVDRDSDGLLDIMTVPGAGSPSQVISFKGTTLATISQYNAVRSGISGWRVRGLNPISFNGVILTRG